MADQRSSRSLLVWVLLAALVPQTLVTPVMCRRKLEGFAEKKNYYPPDPHRHGRPHRRSPCPTPSTPSHGGGGSYGTPTPSHGGGGYYSPPGGVLPPTTPVVEPGTPMTPSPGGGFYSPPSGVSPPTTPVVEPTTPTPPSHGGGGYYSPPSGVSPPTTPTTPLVPPTPYIPTPTTPLVPPTPYTPTPTTPLVPPTPYIPTPTTPLFPPTPFTPGISTPPSPLIPDPNNFPPFFTGSWNYWRTHPQVIWGLFGYWGTLGGLLGGVGTRAANVNLLEALGNTRTDGIGALYREGTASFLNSVVNRRFVFTTQQVRDAFALALASEQAAAKQAQIFLRANEGRLRH